MTPPTPKRCKIKCDMFTCICADGSEAHDPPTPNGEVVRCWLCPGLDAGEALATVQPMHDSRAVVIMDAAAFDAMKAELVAMKNGRDWWEHRAEVAERENGEALAMLAFTGEPSSLWQAAAAARAKLDEAVQKARYESDVAAQAMAAKDAAERERGDADDALAACQAQAAGTIARIFEKLDALTAHMNQVHETLGGSDTVLTLEAAQHVVAKLADAERERDALQERWGTLVDDDGEPLNLGDMQEYIAVLHEAKEKLREKLADAEKDKERLDWMADDPPFDGIGNLDLYDFWHMVAHENGHEEATQEDKRKAFRLLLDTARTAATAQGE